MSVIPSITTPSLNQGIGAGNAQIDRYDIISTGNPFSFTIAQAYSRVFVTNKTQWALAPSTPIVKYSFVTAADPYGYAYSMINVAGSTELATQTFTTGGIYIVNPYQTSISAPLTGTTITAATPAVATVNNTFSNGDLVLFTNVVGMQQISGYVFNISNVSPTGFTIPNLPAATFAGGATSFQVQKVRALSVVVVPSASYIVAINPISATQAVVQLSAPDNFFVGMQLQLVIPTDYGNGWQFANLSNNFFTVTAIGATLNGSTNTITIQSNNAVNVNLIGLTFAFPTSANAAGVSPAQVIPYGQQSPPYAPLSPINTYQNVVSFTGGFLLSLGVNVCGTSGDNLTIWGDTENTIQTNPTILPYIV